MEKMQKFYSIFASAFAVFIVFIIYSANTGSPLPAATLVLSMDHGDKFAHFVLFGFLSFLLNLAFGAKCFRFGPFSIYRGTILVATVALLEEISQRYISTRAFEYYDLLADFGGIVFFAFLTALCAGRRLKLKF